MFPFIFDDERDVVVLFTLALGVILFSALAWNYCAPATFSTSMVDVGVYTVAFVASASVTSALLIRDAIQARKKTQETTDQPEVGES